MIQEIINFIDTYGRDKIVAILIVIVICLCFFLLLRAVAKFIKTLFYGIAKIFQLILKTLKNIKQWFRSAKQQPKDYPEIKLVDGSTTTHLPNIQKDFSDFHNETAESTIRTFLEEYLQIRYGTLYDFQKSQISDKIKLQINKESSGTITDIVFHTISIYSYIKTKESATITYQISVGFTVDGKRIETRYEVDYSYLLEDNSVAIKTMQCPICGAAYKSTINGICVYCGAAYGKDTIMSWDIINVHEF